MHTHSHRFVIDQCETCHSSRSNLAIQYIYRLPEAVSVFDTVCLHFSQVNMISSNTSGEPSAKYCRYGSRSGKQVASNHCIEHDLEYRQQIEGGEPHCITMINESTFDDDDDDNAKYSKQHIKNNRLKRTSQEQLQTCDVKIESSSSNMVQMNTGNYQRSDIGTSRTSMTSDAERMIDSSRTQSSTRKIHLANHFLNRLRGPFKIVIAAPIRVAEVCTQGMHVSDTVVQAVKQGLARQNQSLIEQPGIQNSIEPTFAEITEDWTYEGKNSDRGFSSKSIWMRDPRGRRILVKTQDHPMCAANEWLAYTLGQALGLPVNEVQIAIYQNELVTLHTDVSNGHEKAITFINFPKHIRKTLSADPTMARMVLFDQIIENVDRNPRNVLVSMSKTDPLDSPNKKWKIHLIDHSSCFGMGKLNIISVMACKFHSQHLAVVKFDPADKTSIFEQYLHGLSIVDRLPIRRTLNRFARISDDQLASWMNQIRDLLSVGQYHRIQDVLHGQRDVAKRCSMRWRTSSRCFADKSNETNTLTSKRDNMVLCF